MKRIAIVTGASSGLGREIVRLIDGRRWPHVDEVWAVARRAERLEAVVRTTGVPVRPFCLDLRDEASFDILEAALEEEPGTTVVLLANNAGTGTFGEFALQGRAEAANMVALLVRATVELTYRVLPHMAAGSRIINVSSVAAFIPQPKLAVYAAAKRFVLDFSRALDVELGPVGIHATALCPKFMRTGFIEHVGDEAAATAMERGIGFERTEKVARAALSAARAGKSLCIPSADMRLLWAASHVAPYRAVLAVERKMGII